MKKVLKVFLRADFYELYLERLATKGFKYQSNIVQLIKLNISFNLPPLPLYELLIKTQLSQLNTVNQILRYRPNQIEAGGLVRTGCQIVSKAIERLMKEKEQQTYQHKIDDLKNLETTKINFLLKEIQKTPSFDFKAFLAQAQHSHHFLQIHRFVFPDCTVKLARLMHQKECEQWRAACEPVLKFKILLSKDDQLWLSSKLGH